jgi:hypothetical protein
VRRDFPLAVDPVGVHLLDEESLEAIHERAELGTVERCLGKRVNEVETVVAEEDLLQERRRGPLGLPRLLGDLPGRRFGQLAGVFLHGHPSKTLP